MALDLGQVATIAGAVSAVAGAATALAERSARRRFRAHVDDELALLQFFEGWLRLHDAAGVSPGAARERVAAILPELADFPPRHAQRSALASALLLYWPARRRAWLARAPFYAAGLLAAAIPLSLTLDSAGDHLADDETTTTIVLTLVLSAALAGVAVLLRTIAQRLEEPR